MTNEMAAAHMKRERERERERERQLLSDGMRPTYLAPQYNASFAGAWIIIYPW